MSAESAGAEPSQSASQPVFLRCSRSVKGYLAPALAWPGSPLALISVVTAVLAARLFRLTSRYSVNIFFGDQWGFDDATLFQQHSWWQAFRWQWGPHRLGLGALTQKLLYPWMRWNSRWESFLIGLILLLAAAVALELKRRLFGRLSYADIVIPLVFLSPVSFEAIFGTADLAHGSLPLLLAVCYGLSWTVRPQPWRYLLVLTINFLMIYTGFGLFMGFITPLALTADWWLRTSDPKPVRPWHALAAVLIALLSLASFFWDYTLMARRPLFPIAAASRYFAFMALMFANFMGLSGVNARSILAGSTVLCLLILSLTVGVKQIVSRVPQAGMLRLVGSVLMGYCLFFCLSTAVGRTCFGLPLAMTSRYMMYLMTGLLGVYFSVLSVRRSGLRRGGIVVLLMIGLLSSARVSRHDRNLMRSFYVVKHTWKECYLKIADIQQCEVITRRTLNSPFPATVCQSPKSAHLQQKLTFLQQHRLNLYADSD